MSLHESDVRAALDALRSGWLTMGPRTQAFEAALAAWIDVPYAVAVSSGTAALHLACLAVGLRPGDEAVVPALGARGATDAVALCGAHPVHADVVSPHLPNIDVLEVERRITPRTRAVVAVHLFGYPADAVLLRELCDERGMALVEDCGQALGATLDHHGRQAGTIGDAACFSLGEGRQLSVGEGGAVVTGREDVAARVRLLRSHAMTSGTWDRHRGHQDSYDVIDVGFNFRLDEMRAALARSCLPRVAGAIDARRRLARELREVLEALPGVELCWERESVTRSSHGAFPLLLEGASGRLAAESALAAQGVPCRTERLLAPAGGVPRAAETAARLLSVDLDPAREPSEVARALRAAG